MNLKNSKTFDDKWCQQLLAVNLCNRVCSKGKTLDQANFKSPDELLLACEKFQLMGLPLKLKSWWERD